MRKKDITIGMRVAYNDELARGPLVGAVTALSGGQYTAWGSFMWRERADGIACVDDDGNPFGINPNRMRFVVTEAEHLANVTATEELHERNRIAEEYRRAQQKRFDFGPEPVGDFRVSVDTDWNDPDTAVLRLYGPADRIHALRQRLVAEIAAGGPADASLL